MPETYQEFIDRIRREAIADELGGFGLDDLDQTPEEMRMVLEASSGGMLPLPPVSGVPQELIVPRRPPPPLPLEPTSLSADRAFPGDFAPPMIASPSTLQSSLDTLLARAPREPGFYAATDRRSRRQFRRQLREPLDLARVGQDLPGLYRPGPRHEGHLARAAQLSPGAIAAWMASRRREGEALAQGPASGMMRRRLDEMQADLDNPDTPRDEQIRLQIRIRKLREQIEIQRGLEERKVGGEEHLRLAGDRLSGFRTGERATPHITGSEYNAELDRIRREQGPLAADQYARQTGLTVGGRTGVFTPEELPYQDEAGNMVGGLPISDPTAMQMASAEAGDYRAVTNPLTGNTTLVPNAGFEILQPLDERGFPIAGARGEMMPAGAAAERRAARSQDVRVMAADWAEKRRKGERSFYGPTNITTENLEEAAGFDLADDREDTFVGSGIPMAEGKERLAEWANEVMGAGPSHLDWEVFKQFRDRHSAGRRELAGEDREFQEDAQKNLDEARAARMGTPRQLQAAMDSNLRRIGMAMTSGFPSGSGVRANVFPAAPGLAGMDPRVAAAALAAQAQMGVARAQNEPFRMMMMQQMEEKRKVAKKEADQEKIAELVFGGMDPVEAEANVMGWKAPPEKPPRVRPGPDAGALVGAVVADPIGAFSATRVLAVATAKLAMGDFEGAVGGHTMAEWDQIATAIGYDSLDGALGNMAESQGIRPGTPEHDLFIARMKSHMKP